MMFGRSAGPYRWTLLVSKDGSAGRGCYYARLCPVIDLARRSGGCTQREANVAIARGFVVPCTQRRNKVALPWAGWGGPRASRGLYRVSDDLAANEQCFQ